jgi:hypothetical protein
MTHFARILARPLIDGSGFQGPMLLSRFAPGVILKACRFVIVSRATRFRSGTKTPNRP